MAAHGSAARHTFYYLLILVTLGFTAIGIGQILFELIEHFLPDSASYYDFSQYSLRFGISSVIVSTPIYWYITHSVNKELESKQLDADSLVRKWLTYLILLISSIVVIGDLMAILQDFLSGELTMRFFLKCLVVLIISATVFGYYLFDIRRHDFKMNQQLMSFRIWFFVLVIGSLVGGLLVMESPFAARQLRLDNERVNRLQNISYQVQDYYRSESKLPQSLDDLSVQLQSFDVVDPETNQSFDYRVVSADQYELCAEFSRSNQEENDQYRSYPYYNEWYHEAGRQCFTLKVDLEGGTPVPIKVPVSR